MIAAIDYFQPAVLWLKLLKQLHLLIYIPIYLFQIENMEHCDFVPLRNMLIRTHLQDLKEVTNNVHYENFRCRKLAGVAGGTTEKIPNKV